MFAELKNVCNFASSNKNKEKMKIVCNIHIKFPDHLSRYEVSCMVECLYQKLQELEDGDEYITTYTFREKTGEFEDYEVIVEKKNNTNYINVIDENREELD